MHGRTVDGRADEQTTRKTAGRTDEGRHKIALCFDIQLSELTFGGPAFGDHFGGPVLESFFGASWCQNLAAGVPKRGPDFVPTRRSKKRSFLFGYCTNL